MSARKFFSAVAPVVSFLLLSAATFPAQAQRDRPEVTVAFVVDGADAVETDRFYPLVREELARVLGSDFTVAFPEDLFVAADFTREGCRRALDRVFADERVDLVVTTGFIGSLEACLRAQRPRPVIATLVLDPEAQGVPVVGGASGRPNLSFVVPGNPFSEDIVALYEVAPFHRLAILGSPVFFRAFAENPVGDREPMQEVPAEYTVVAVGETAAKVLAGIPPDADAVYLLPMMDMSFEELQEVFAGLRARGLPSAAVVGEPAVRQGALIGVTPADWLPRVARRAALNARRILAGESAADLPVVLPRQGRLFVNMETARRVGARPSFAIMTDAVLIDERREAVDENWDIYRVMETALAQNLDLAAARQDVAAGAEEVRVARSALLPQINLQATGSLIDVDRARTGFYGPERLLSGSAGLTQVIWSDGVRANAAVQRHLQAARSSDRERVQLDVGLEAARSYLNVLRAFTAENIQKENLSFSRSNLERARVRVAVGDADRAELFRWESKIATEKAEVIAVIARRNVAEMELNRVLRRPLEESFHLADITLEDELSLAVDPRVDRHTRDPWSLRDFRRFLVQKGLEAAPELHRIKASLAAQERIKTAASRSFWSPDIALSGDLTHRFAKGGEGAGVGGPEVGGPDDTDWNLALGLSLPLFEGGARFAEDRQAAADIRRLQAERGATADRIEQRIRVAVHVAGASRANIDLSREAAAAAGQNLDLVAENYAGGRVKLIDLLDAQVNALNAELAAADAVYGYLLDLMEVERAVGSFTFYAPAAARESWIQELESYFNELENR